MWGGGQGNSSPDRFDGQNSANNTNGGSEYNQSQARANANATAAASQGELNYMAAARMAEMGQHLAYGTGHAGLPPTEVAAMGADHENAALMFAQAQRARELELFHLQQQMQERQALEDAARNQMLEHAAREQLQEYERTRMEIALAAEAEMQQQQRDREREAELESMRAQASEAAVRTNEQLRNEVAEREHIEEQLRLLIAKKEGEKMGTPVCHIPGITHSKSAEEDNHNLGEDDLRPPQPKKKSEPPAIIHNAATVAAASAVAAKKETTSSPKRKKSPSKDTSSTPTKKRKKAPSKASSGAATTKAKRGAKKGAAGGGSLALLKRSPGVPSMDDIVPAITDAQYENVEALMADFCKVPFLAEFSRPVSLLHPELVKLYSKIVHHPMDLGHVCRSIRRREYKNTRAIQLDVWRIFSNCIKFHTSPTNKDNSVPSFISIAIHLKDHFNSLWREYMMPSDAPPRAPGKVSHIHSMFQKRAETRKERLPQVSSTILTPKCMRKISQALESFILLGGKVDKLDKDAILGDTSGTGDIGTFIQSLRGVTRIMAEKIASNQEYTVLELHRDLKRCYTEDVFEHEILKKMKISQRLDRILGKALSPIHEIGCRGVNQSSIWGCMAAAIWARESKKKPYWPAIVLGILAPDDQKEDWHQSLTDRNEARLPEKLLTDLKMAKRRAELGLKKQSSDLMSYFLVEFMGTHEFIWVKESDIIETFDPEEDVNIAAAAGNITKKRRSNAFNTQLMSNAIEEGRWALEEFEIQLNNTCGDTSDDEGEDEEDEKDTGYTYDVLNQSDEEADELDEDDKKGQESDIEELNELLASDGVLDYSVEGRKKAKARATALKKQHTLQTKKEREKAMAAKTKSKTPTKVDSKINDYQTQKAQREREARQKKRSRDHEKSLKDVERKAKRKKTADKRSIPSDIPDKRGRADTIAKGFLMRRCIDDDSGKLIGAAFQPTASVEPSGLLGMALAFRAAAGEIPFVETNGKPFCENSWDKFNVDGPTDSAERCKRLKDQIDLIGKEIIKVDAATDKRLALSKDAEKVQLAAQKSILKAEEEVKKEFAKAKRARSATPKKTVVASDKMNVDPKVEDVKKEDTDTNGSACAKPIANSEFSGKIDNGDEVNGDSSKPNNVESMVPTSTHHSLSPESKSETPLKAKDTSNDCDQLPAGSAEVIAKLVTERDVAINHHQLSPS